MNPEFLSRIQFGLTSSFHFLFPPLSLGVGILLVIFGVQSVRTNDPKWRQLSLFWVKIYGLIFSMGVATGLVQEFQFGTNWSVYSRYVGNVFGSLLAAEGIFAFMLEGGFLGLMLFGGARLGNRLWLFATTMVVVGAHFSALWIIMANSWMQTPQGYSLATGQFGTQALMTSFKDVVFTPMFWPALIHTFVASWMMGAAFVMSVGAWYLLKQRHTDIARTMLLVSLPIFTVLAPLQLALFGANQATAVVNNQPVKLAAMEGVWQTQDCAPMYFIGWVDVANQTTHGIHVPCLLSILVGKSTSTVVQGLDSFPQDQWANIQLVFQVYHVMVVLGMLYPLIGLVAIFLLWRKKLHRAKWMLWPLIITIFLVEATTITGWWTTEFGRQPWIVWQQLKTSDAVTPTVSTGTVLGSLIMFAVLYGILLVVFLWLLNRTIKKGPDAPPPVEESASLPDTFGEIFRHRPRASAGVE